LHAAPVRCYLVKHGNEYLLWDTGQPDERRRGGAEVSLVDQLAQLKLNEQMKYVGVSHYHGDHIGQGDWNALTAAKPAPGVNPERFAGWIKGENKVEPVPLDKDVFGDGTIVRTRRDTRPAITA
jgi:glyoxylase-like metal-dependent hydrolase (beta-lactamase superfamily II)